MYLTLNDAAKETGKSKSTISKYLKEGKLSYIEKTDKGYKIDPSELFRVFAKSEQKTPQNEQTRTTLEHNKNIMLEEKIKMLEELLDNKSTENQNLWQQLDKAQETLKAQTMLLQDLREKPPEKPVEKRKKILGIF